MGYPGRDGVCLRVLSESFPGQAVCISTCDATCLHCQLHGACLPTLLFKPNLRTSRALAKSIRILDKHTFGVPAHMVERSIQNASRFILGYTWLNHANIIAQRKQYKLRPKRLGCQKLFSNKRTVNLYTPVLIRAQNPPRLFLKVPRNPKKN